jgi:hypothetical protein
VTEEPGRADEYLGPSILAKLAQGDFGEDEEN